MIVKPTVTELLKKAKNRYELVIATSKRARQIAMGDEPLTKVKEESPVTLAANEIAEGKVTIFLKVDKEELKNRLINRGDNLSEADMQLRLNRLEYEESKINLYDYVIKNDDLEKTVQIIMTIIENEKRLENL